MTEEQLDELQEFISIMGFVRESCSIARKVVPSGSDIHRHLYTSVNHIMDLHRFLVDIRQNERVGVGK